MLARARLSAPFLFTCKASAWLWWRWAGEEAWVWPQGPGVIFSGMVRFVWFRPAPDFDILDGALHAAWYIDSQHGWIEDKTAASVLVFAVWNVPALG